MRDNDIARRRVLVGLGGAGLASIATPVLSAPVYNFDNETGSLIGSGQNSGGQQNETALLSYIPITQIRARKVSFYRNPPPSIDGSDQPGVDRAALGFKEYDWGELRQDEIQSLLSNYSQWVTLYRFEGQAEIPLPFVSATLRAGRFRIVIDFLRYMTQTVVDGDETLGRVVVGVGLRTVAEVNTRSATGATLIALAARASANQASGQLRFDSIGIASNGVSALMPTNVSLDESGVVQAAAATAAIKGLMDDPDTILVPHVIAVQVGNPSGDSATERLINRASQG